jgi:hypothetical protein
MLLTLNFCLVSIDLHLEVDIRRILAITIHIVESEKGARLPLCKILDVIIVLGERHLLVWVVQDFGVMVLIEGLDVPLELFLVRWLDDLLRD